jgi:SAM-dependent methyltransferase
MLSGPDDIYASAPLRSLMADESRVLLPEIQRCSGDHGLLLSAAAGDQPPALPMLACWTRLEFSGDRYRGDLLARADESLPFMDDAFELVMLRHVLETSTMPQEQLAEAVRVLSPGGLMVLSGVHPLSLWAPWMYRKGRRQHLHLRMPLQLGEWLRRSALQVEAVTRVGRFWPGAGQAAATLGSGGYLLLARKQRRAVTPLRLVPARIDVSGKAGLAPSARRLSA